VREDNPPGGGISGVTEHPIVLQLGGADPDIMHKAAALAAHSEGRWDNQSRHGGFRFPPFSPIVINLPNKFAPALLKERRFADPGGGGGWACITNRAVLNYLERSQILVV